MGNIATQIVGKQLSELGVEQSKPAPATRRTQATYEEPRQYRVERPRAVVTHRKNEWTKDGVCERLEEAAKNWKVEGGTASMSDRDLDAIVSIAATDLANALEHAGLVYRTGTSPALLADMVSDFVVTQMRVLKDGKYLDIGGSS